MTDGDRPGGAELAEENAALRGEVARLRDELQASNRGLSESLEQQTASAAVLRAIAGTPGDAAGVLDTIARTAQGLFDASSTSITRIEDGRFRVAAGAGSHGAAIAEELPKLGVDRQTIAGTAALEKRVVHVEDIAQALDTYPKAPGAGRDDGSVVSAPLLSKGEVIGTMTISRHEVRPFTDKEIELVASFADQAVIAIENTRLLDELRESLDNQTASTEILRTIAAAPAQAEKALDTIARTTARLFGASGAAIRTVDGDQLKFVGGAGSAAFNIRAGLGDRYPLSPDTLPGFTVLNKRGVHMPDVDDPDPEIAHWPGLVPQRASGIRTVASAPLIREDEAIGAIMVQRAELKPFSDKELSQLANFADQAVIAIENARLLAELREALEQQTAMSEVLSTISASPGELQPVFETMLANAVELCQADGGGILRVEGEKFIRVAARSTTPHLSIPGEIRYLAGSPPERMLETKRTVHVPDLAAELERLPEMVTARAAFDSGVRAILWVPMVKDGDVVAAFVLQRQEQSPFSDVQIALLERFADQAAIAIENARLLEELRESLERRTATAEVLAVISASPGEVQPVFDAMLDNAVRLCDAGNGSVFTVSGDVLHRVANFGKMHEIKGHDEIPIIPDSPPGRIRETLKTAHLPDLPAEIEKQAALRGDDNPLVTAGRAVVDQGIRSALWVPMVKDNAMIGAFVFNRSAARPFTDAQIELVETFASQAVIAIENARLLNDLNARNRDLAESLEQQSATSDILRAIATTPGDAQRVMQVIAENAGRICEAVDVNIYRPVDDKLRLTVCIGAVGALGPVELPIGPGSAAGTAFAERRTVDVADMTERLAEFPNIPPETARRVPTVLAVPMLRGDQALGVIIVVRGRVQPFTEDHKKLMASFADQAVIAIENARLLDELRESLENQTASADILRVISSSAADTQPVFDAIVEAGLRLFAGDTVAISLPDGDQVRVVAIGDVEPSRAENWRSRFPVQLTRDYMHGVCILDREIIDIADVSEAPGEFLPGRHNFLAGGYRAITMLPMIRGNEAIGAISIVRVAPGPLTDKQLELLKTFADQAVIAIENARLLDELRSARDAAEQAVDELKEAQASLIHAEKMASLGQLTAGIAHEIKNPLNFVNNFAGLSVELLDELKEAAGPALATLSDDVRDEVDEVIGMLTGNLDKVAEHGRRADGIVKSMLAHSRGGGGERQSVDLNALIEESLNLAYHGARAQDQNFNITMERDLDPALAPIDVVPQDLTRVFLNLFGNGFYAANKRAKDAADPEFHPSLAVATRDAGDDVEIRIRDNGTGIPAALQEKLFEPFFTTKPTGEGTGLGLSISYEIVTKQHGGTITVDSEPGAFTEFRITIPKQAQG